MYSNNNCSGKYLTVVGPKLSRPLGDTRITWVRITDNRCTVFTFSTWHWRELRNSHCFGQDRNRTPPNTDQKRLPLRQLRR